MPLAHLTPADHDLVHQCLVALRRGGFLDEAAIATRIGVPVPAFDDLLARWPEVDGRDDASPACVAITNALTEVCHGVHIPEEDWPTWFTGSRGGVRDAYERWMRTRGWAGGSPGC
jgi:hypothetical protein